jgi:hypothetical protein
MRIPTELRYGRSASILEILHRLLTHDFITPLNFWYPSPTPLQCFKSKRKCDRKLLVYGRQLAAPVVTEILFLPSH